MKKSQLRKLIRENIRQIMSEQGGSQFDYNVWVVFINGKITGHQNPCNFLSKQYNNLYDKLINDTNPNNPNHHDWINMLVAKLTWLAVWIQIACDFGDPVCCAISTTDVSSYSIPEQRGGGGLPPIPQAYMAIADKAMIAKATADATKSATDHYSAKGMGTGNVSAAPGRLNENWDFNSWSVQQTMAMDGSMWTGAGMPNPCNYLINKVTKKSADLANANPNNPNHAAWISRMNQKLGFWNQEIANRGCQPGS